MEIAIKLEPGMAEKPVWAHFHCHGTSDGMHPIWVPWNNALKSYNQIRKKLRLSRVSGVTVSLWQLQF